MKLKQPYYLFFDFDHTVFVDKQISNATRAAMQRAQEAGHKLILCTGRSQGHLCGVPAIKTIPWDGEIWGGADIYYAGKCYETNTASFADVEAWFAYAERHGYDLILEGQKELNAFHFSQAPASILPEFPIKQDKQHHNSHPTGEALKKCFESNPVTKITVPGRELDASDFPKTAMTPIVHGHYTEAFAAGCDKGTAIQHFCEHLGISIEQCACFGDSMNDAPMFRVCPVSISVAWAPDELVAISTYHAKTKESVAEGITWIMETLAE